MAQDADNEIMIKNQDRPIRKERKLSRNRGKLGMDPWFSLYLG